jgi:hypothetical protein
LGLGFWLTYIVKAQAQAQARTSGSGTYRKPVLNLYSTYFFRTIDHSAPLCHVTESDLRKRDKSWGEKLKWKKKKKDFFKKQFPPGVNVMIAIFVDFGQFSAN